MNTDADIWFAFARTLGMLFVVLAFLLVVFYLFRKFSGFGLGRGPQNLIRVLAVHHLSPKEKFVLVAVEDQTVLVGVSPAGMSKLADMDGISAPEPKDAETGPGFARVLGQALKPARRGAGTMSKETSHD